MSNDKLIQKLMARAMPAHIKEDFELTQTLNAKMQAILKEWQKDLKELNALVKSIDKRVKQIDKRL